jgi:hypothetical protein
MAMKPKCNFDHDFANPSWRWKPLARARWLLLIAVVAALLAVIPTRTTRSPQVFAQGAKPVLAAHRVKVQQPAPSPLVALIRPEPAEHFTVMARPSIDPEMVHRAPAGIDEAMVVQRPDQRALPPLVIAPQPGEPIVPKDPDRTPRK